METQQIDDLKLKDLQHFKGTQKYVNVMGANVTDGVTYIMQNGYSWFITDFIVIAKMKAKLKREEFLSVKLKLNGQKAFMIVTDGNENKLYTQKYDYTSAKKEIQLFFIANVLMLSSEY